MREPGVEPGARPTLSHDALWEDPMLPLHHPRHEICIWLKDVITGQFLFCALSDKVLQYQATRRPADQ